MKERERERDGDPFFLVASRTGKKKTEIKTTDEATGVRQDTIHVPYDLHVEQGVVAVFFLVTHLALLYHILVLCFLIFAFPPPCV